MLDIPVTIEQLKYVCSLTSTTNFGQRGDADGNKQQQFVGILGQTIICDMLHYARPTNTGFDGGIDIVLNGITVDVKTMCRKVPMKNNYVHNFMGSQIKFNTDVLVFTSYNIMDNVLTVCGWLPKDLFIEKSSFFPYNSKRYRSDGTYFRVRGKSGMYEIANYNLIPINSIDELNTGLNIYKTLKTAV